MPSADPGRTEVEFFYGRFRADRDVLTPRLETESLVRRSIAELRSLPADLVVDVGTGSGIIAVSLARAFPEVRTIGLDVSLPALEIARENGERNGVSVEWMRSDLLEALAPNHFSCRFPFFAANLPYIRSGDPDVGADVLADDPHLALFGGDRTGFECVDRFVTACRAWADAVLPQCLRVALEFGHDQLPLALAAADREGFTSEPFEDLSGLSRFTLLTYAPRPFPARR